MTSARRSVLLARKKDAQRRLNEAAEAKRRAIDDYDTAQDDLASVQEEIDHLTKEGEDAAP